MIQILSPYHDFEGTENINILQVLIWGFGGCWMFLTGVWHLDYDLDMLTGLWFTTDPNFGSLLWFWRCKEHPCPLSPHLGLWRMLEVPDWVGLVTELSYTHFPNFSSLSWFWSAKNALVPEVLILALEDAGCSWFGFGILIMFCIWSIVFDTPVFHNLTLYLDFGGAKNIHVI